MEFEKLKKILSELLTISPDTIFPETDFVQDLGLDSLRLFQVVLEIEKEFEIEIPVDRLEQLHTISDALEAIRQSGRQVSGGE